MVDKEDVQIPAQIAEKAVVDFGPKTDVEKNFDQEVQNAKNDLFE